MSYQNLDLTPQNDAPLFCQNYPSRFYFEMAPPPLFLDPVLLIWINTLFVLLKHVYKT
jgi:hypothetical protein